MNISIKKIISWAVFVYFLVAPLTYHPDTKLTLYYPSLKNGKVWNVYRYMAENQSNMPDFHYPPLNYLLLKIEWPLARLVGGSGLEAWLVSGSMEAPTNPQIFRYNLAVKTPLLLMTLSAGYLIYLIVKKWGGKEKEATRASIWWLFNPLTLYSVVIMGQNDILAILPFLLGLYFLIDKWWLAVFFFGFSISIKAYPLIWAILIALWWPTKDKKKKLLMLLIPPLFYFLTLVPFLRADYFRQAVLSSGLMDRIFVTSLSIGFGESLLVVPLLLVFWAWKNMNWGEEKKKDLKKLVHILWLGSLIVLAFSHFHPQWFLWLMPFASIYLSLINKKKRVRFLFANLVLWLAWLGIVLLFKDKFLYWGIWSPTNPYLLKLPLLSSFLMAKNIDVVRLTNLCHTIMAGVSVYFLVRKSD
ncbi:hypothetical protein DRH14_01990 [Candidatus Shapirobacteria bacterium]|nr:MAG: hypothetical protein DRH14_01990 [Candidatus Shapirobacteria bacterium]